MNVCQLVGPALGGILLEAGGFYFPFAILGAIQIVLSLACVVIMPPPYYREEDCDHSHKNKKNKVIFYFEEKSCSKS